MASFASSATMCGARKHAWTNRKRLKIGVKKRAKKLKKDEKKTRVDKTVFSDFVRFMKNVTFPAEVGRI